jgi:phosphate-selective porin OprO/OprP
MNIKGRIQARVTDLDSKDDAKSGTNFSLARVRLGVDGKAGEEYIKYKVDFDMGTQKNLYNEDSGDDNDPKSFTLQDAYVDIQANEYAAFEFGQFKFPFGREEQISSGSISLMERSAASNTFAPGKEPGAMLHGDAAEGQFEYYVAVANGGGQSVPNAENDDGDGLRSGVRVVYNPLGPYKADGPAFQTVKDGSTKVGIGASYMQNNDSSGKNTLANGTDTDTAGVDFQVLSGPFSVLAEYFDGSSRTSGSPDVDSTGSTVQVGYFVVPSVWEVVARTSTVDNDTSPDIDELTVGVNRYIDGHNAKWMVDVNTRSPNGTSANNKELRLQYQAIF